MPKPFKSHNSLLKLMRKRNISIAKGSEGSKVKNILSRENYYSVAKLQYQIEHFVNPLTS